MFTVSTGGYQSRHQLSFSMVRPRGLPKYVLLLVKARSEFTILENTFLVEPNCCILIRPNTPYKYHSIKGAYVDDWLHFECSDPALLESFQVPFHSPIYLSTPTRFSLYIQQILWEVHFVCDPQSAENIDMLLKIMFNHLKIAKDEKNHPDFFHPYSSKLQNLRLSLQAQPHLKYFPAREAQTLGISTSYFQRLYAETFGVSFQADLIHFRIEYAKNLITETSLPMEAIAEICGYSSEVHFYRQFKKYVGMTPAAYRHGSV